MIEKPDFDQSEQLATTATTTALVTRVKRKTIGPATKTNSDKTELKKAPRVAIDTLRRKYNSNIVIVNNKSNFKSHLVKCQTIMDNIHNDELLIKAIGKATDRASNLATQLNANNFNTFELETRSHKVRLLGNKMTIPIKGANKDGFNPDEIDIADDKLKIIEIPSIEIKVRKHKIEIERMLQARKKR